MLPPVRAKLRFPPNYAEAGVKSLAEDRGPCRDRTDDPRIKSLLLN